MCPCGLRGPLGLALREAPETEQLARVGGQRPGSQLRWCWGEGSRRLPGGTHWPRVEPACGRPGRAGRGGWALAPGSPSPSETSVVVLLEAVLRPRGRGVGSRSLQGQCANGSCWECHRVWAPSCVPVSPPPGGSVCVSLLCLSVPPPALKPVCEADQKSMCVSFPGRGLPGPTSHGAFGPTAASGCLSCLTVGTGVQPV